MFNHHDVQRETVTLKSYPERALEGSDHRRDIRRHGRAGAIRSAWAARGFLKRTLNLD